MIVQTIQLALTPVFVLVAIGNILNILSTRLGRVVDRARTLQEMHSTTEDAQHDMVVSELRLVHRRMTLITHAVRFMVLSALAIGVTVAILFLSGLSSFEQYATAAASWHAAAAVTFLTAIVLLLVALVLFLRETQVAAEALRIPTDYLELHRTI